MSTIQGLAPFLPPSRPRDAARWWCAQGTLEGDRLRIGTLDEADAPPAVSGACGLAAPCSLPRAFLAQLGLDGPRDDVLATLRGWKPGRLLREARAFASRARRGRKHPSRCQGESTSALDRSRLARFAAALPLLAATPTLPWADAEPPFLFEVDVPAFLAALDLEATGLGGDAQDAIARRARVLGALHEGAPGFAIDTAPRDFAVASLPALEAVVAATAAAWLSRAKPEAPPRDAEAWIPLP